MQTGVADSGTVGAWICILNSSIFAANGSNRYACNFLTQLTRPQQAKAILPILCRILIYPLYIIC